MEIIGKTDIDYFHIYCKKCNTPTDNEYIGTYGVPYIEVVCPRCKESFTFKLDQLHWKGLNKPLPIAP